MNDDAEMPQEMEEAMDRIVAMEKMELSSLLDHLMMLKNQESILRKIEIYESKELHTAETDQDEGRFNKNQLVDEIDELHHALVTHKLVRDAMQNTVFNVQKQEVVSNSLRKVETEDTVDHFPEKGALLFHYSNNLDTCKILKDVVQEKEELDKEILELRLKYNQCLDDIKNKWKACDSNMVPVSDESEEVAKFRTTVKEREDKLRIIVSILQGIISTSGLNWGAEDYYVKVLLLCDLAVTHGDKAEQDSVIKDLERLRNLKIREGKRKGRDIKSYFTSSPRPKKK
ncbi:uncharacterized protein LOC121869318 isoform X2 [Homarus americanus]|uniref:Putative Centromere protein H-like n=2 Tax=Homarus americanus TaxID=6706 RepID=A0A8J5MVZ0_HOMAM|nr:uncharacterized protein LOC121869318 isoform X2 [Homarus americanus]XP_042226518.1 uncharacterized protein LOC121869318 isoform X2 [Homarus americanus]XP_042226519.1 uncharacterized protein LOC121869318 isoform X2 [Homarus americanus]KAG7166475.1 putative Centromere protein H-like [Homarus americanus]